MKKFILIFGLSIFVALQGITQSLNERLTHLSQSNRFTFEQMDVDSTFTEKYMIWLEQPVDHANPDGQHFRQRIFLSHAGYDKPVVFITEGYGASYAENPDYVSELAGLLGSTQICVEHRYFGTSVPDSMIWEYLTVANAAADQHAVVELLKDIYKGKWISTGISKGGQTAMYHRYFFPDDVDITIPYVAPLNFSTEDKRVYDFLGRVSSDACREMVLNFQKELFRNKKSYLPEFEKLASEKNLNYSMGTEKAFELTVLEYSFAFFQWGSLPCDDITEKGSAPAEMIKHLDKVAGIDWIARQGIDDIRPFFYQAMHEIGFYGYDISPFKAWTVYQSNPTFEFTLPEGIAVEYKPELMQAVDCFIRHHADNMIFIYGEYDPWSATAVDLTMSTNSLKIVKPGGSHLTRINNLDAKQKKLVMDTLEKWLNE